VASAVKDAHARRRGRPAPRDRRGDRL